MFRVICVTPITIIGYGCENLPRPEVGDIGAVIRQKKIEGHMYYALEGYGISNGFKADHFATLPDQPAEVIEEETVNLQPA